MDLTDTLNISITGLNAQRVRLQTIAGNLANARTTRTPEGGPYQRRTPIFEAKQLDPFGNEMDRAMAEVKITQIHKANSDGEVVYDPGHPDADADGYVTYPDINMMHEMVDMMTTQRSYEANANVMETTRELALKALEIGK
jgi:flagellar basal-body rod protein FlgC